MSEVFAARPPTYQFLKNEAGALPLTPPLSERRRRSVDSPSMRPRPRAGSDSSQYQRLSDTLKVDPTTNNKISVHNGTGYKPFNSSSPGITRRSEPPPSVKPKIQATSFGYKKIDGDEFTGVFPDDTFSDWHFNQPNAFASFDEDPFKSSTDSSPEHPEDAAIFEVVSRFISRHDDEIDLNVGNKISVVEKYPDFWYRGINTATGKQGIFPSLYVKEATSATTPAERPSFTATFSSQHAEKADPSQSTVVPAIPKKTHRGRGSEPVISLTSTTAVGQLVQPDGLETIKETAATRNSDSLPPRLSKPPAVPRKARSPQPQPSHWVSLDEADTEQKISLEDVDFDLGGFDDAPIDTNRHGSSQAATVSDFTEFKDFDLTFPDARPANKSPVDNSVPAAALPVKSPAADHTTQSSKKPFNGTGDQKRVNVTVEDNDSDYSEVKFSVFEFEKLTSKVGALPHSSASNEGASAIEEATRSTTNETSHMPSYDDYEDINVHSALFDKLKKKVESADKTGQKKSEVKEDLTKTMITQAKLSGGIVEPKKVKGSLKVAETGRTVFSAKLLGCVQVKRHRGSGALRDAISKIQTERHTNKVTDKKPCLLEISEKGFVLHDNSGSMEPAKPLMYSLFRVISCANLPGSDKVFGIYIKDTEHEIYHCYAFEAENTNQEIAVAFGDVFKRFYKQLMKKKPDQQR